MTAADHQHTPGPFGTFKTYSTLATTNKKKFNCYYRTEIFRPYNSKTFPKEMLSHGTKRRMLKKNLRKLQLSFTHWESHIMGFPGGGSGFGGEG